MAMFGKVLEPVGYMQTMRTLVEGICTYLGGSASAEETDLARKNLDYIDQELAAAGPGLLTDQEVHRLEDDLAVVYYQLGAVVRAQSEFTKRETEVFLQYVQEHRLERQLTALHSRLMGVSVLTDQPTLLEELVQSRKPKRWEMREFCVKVSGGQGVVSHQHTMPNRQQRSSCYILHFSNQLMCKSHSLVYQNYP